jgi:hypothetical protein
MKFFVAITALATLAVAAPAATATDYNPEAVPILEDGTADLAARQTYPGCNDGMRPGDYNCFANLNERFSYLGQCGSDHNIHVSTY